MVGDQLGAVAFSGQLTNADAQYVHHDFAVPPGVGRLVVSFAAAPRDDGRIGFGLFGPASPVRPERPTFRGWSDHWRAHIVVGSAGTTLGYLPGQIEAGTWTFVLAPFLLGSEAVPWDVSITFHRDDGARPPEPCWAPLELNTTEGWYRGDLHLHTEHSADAPPGMSNFPLEELLEHARHAGLDFIGSTDHNTPSAHAVWGRHTGDDLLVLNGLEVTLRGGHAGAIGISPGTWIDYRACTVDEAAAMVAEIHAAGGLAVANHPLDAGCPDCDWLFGFHLGFDAIEVWNSHWRPANESALEIWEGLLREGARLTAVGGSDAHRHPDVVGLPQTVVRSAGLSRAGLLEGLREGRAYITSTAGMEIDFWCSTTEQVQASMGDELGLPEDRRIRVHVRLRGVPAGTLTLHDAHGVLIARDIEPDAGGQDLAVDLESPMGLVRAELRDRSGDMQIITNPIWLPDSSSTDPGRPA